MNETYIDMLKQEFLDKKARRPLYSERAFARDLKVSSGFISMLFNGKRQLSPKMALKLVQTLNWSETKTEKFFASLQQSQFTAKTPPKKTVHPLSDIADSELELDTFRLVSNVYHFSVLELIQNHKIKHINEICKYFKLTRLDAELMVKRLERLGMISFNGKYFMADTKNRRLKSTPSEAIRNYHKKTLDLAQESIDQQDFKERELKSLTLSIDPKQLQQAKKSIASFFKSFNKKYGNTSKGEIYQLNLQLFSLNDKGE